MSADGHHTIKENVNGISTLDEPSVEWGWHQHSIKAGWAIGGFFTLFLFAMLFGNHDGNVENLWVIGIGIVLALWMVFELRPKKDDTAKKSRVYVPPADHYAAINAAATGPVRTAPAKTSTKA